MIKSLILTALLTSGVGANATPLLNKEAETEQTQIVERNNANIFNYADGTRTSETNAGTEWTQSNTFTNYNRTTWYNTIATGVQNLYINKKWEITTNHPTDAGQILGNLYKNEKLIRFYQTNPNLQTGWRYDINAGTYGVNTEYNTNTDLYAIQYTPYQNITTNYINIRTQTKPEVEIRVTDPEVPINFPTSIEQINFKFKFTFHILQSTNNWSRAIDMTMTENATSNEDLYNTLKSSQNGYTYTEQTQYETATIATATPEYIMEEETSYCNITNLTQTNLYTDLRIPINPKQTNYVIIYKTITFLIEDQDGNDISTIFNNSDIGNGLYITGISDGIANSNQNPNQVTSTYQNLNTENVIADWMLTRPTPIVFHGQYAPPIEMEVIDIPSIMFNILSMPFTFVSTAFNLTLFPGTPYQVNIGSIILMLFGLLVFIFLFKIILKVFK